MIAAMFSVVAFSQDKKLTELKPAQLPKEVTKWISQNLSGGTIVRAGKIEEKGVVTYGAVVEARGQKHAYLFDKDGKFTGKGDQLFDGKGQTPAAKPPVKSSPATDAAPKK